MSKPSSTRADSSSKRQSCTIANSEIRMIGASKSSPMYDHRDVNGYSKLFVAPGGSSNWHILQEESIAVISKAIRDDAICMSLAYWF